MILLSTFYETGNSGELKSFLYETSIFGLESAPPGVKDKRAQKKQAYEERTSAWLRHTRKEKGFTQKTLAQAVGIATNTVANIEQGQRRGSDEVWEKLERVLGK